MASKTEICNIAIGHTGTAKSIAALDTESSSEAISCRRFYDIARDATLRDFNWPFARRFVTLGLVSEDPTSEWKYSYRQPADVIKLRRIVTGVKKEDRDAREPFVVASDASGILIYTDKPNAQMEYTTRVEDTSLFPSDFTVALGYRLSSYIAPSLTKGDPFGIINRVQSLYIAEISRAKANSLNEEQSPVEPESEFIRARG